MSERTSPMTITGEGKPVVAAWTSLDWQVNLFNEINSEAESRKDVSVMIFQAAHSENIYTSAWCVLDVPSPGRVGPIKLPKRVQIGVLDKVEDDIPRLAGPVDVDFGQSVDVVQQNEERGAEIKISGDPQPDKEITVTNSKGNVQPLEIALYKSGKKLVSYKDVVPNTSVSFRLEPEVLYVTDGANLTKGHEFEASNEIQKATKFSLSDKLEINIKITRKHSGELEFTELEQVQDE